MIKAGSHGVAVGWHKCILIRLNRSPLAFFALHAAAGLRLGTLGNNKWWMHWGPDNCVRWADAVRHIQAPAVLRQTGYDNQASEVSTQLPCEEVDALSQYPLSLGALH